MTNNVEMKYIYMTLITRVIEERERLKHIVNRFYLLHLQMAIER